jgi:glycosyltransferase involved in cell wall biosynthesis
VTNVTCSIVIPAHNAAATLGAQLDAVLGQAPPDAEVIVVDNNSSDGTAALVARFHERDPRIRLVAATGGSGPSYARNAGARAAASETLLFCDADDVVADGWCTALATSLRDHEFVGGPIEVDQLNPRWLADGRGRWGVGQPGVFGGIKFAHGCNLGIRRSAYLKAGGLDEEMHAGEEIDLALRLRADAVPYTFVPDAVVHYRYRGEIRALARQAFAYGRVVPTLTRRGATVPGFVAPPTRWQRVGWLAARAYPVFDRAGRVRWVWLAAGLAGQLWGSWEADRRARREAR